MALQAVRLLKNPNNTRTTDDPNPDYTTATVEMAAALAAVRGANVGEICTIDSVLAQVLIDAGAAATYP